MKFGFPEVGDVLERDDGMVLRTDQWRKRGAANDLGSVSPDELVVSPGEFLAFHFNLSTGPSGDLDVRPIFEVEVR